MALVNKHRQEGGAIIGKTDREGEELEEDTRLGGVE